MKSVLPNEWKNNSLETVWDVEDAVSVDAEVAEMDRVSFGHDRGVYVAEETCPVCGKNLWEVLVLTTKGNVYSGQFLCGFFTYLTEDVKRINVGSGDYFVFRCLGCDTCVTCAEGN